MEKINSLLRKFWKDESGLSVLEYVVGAAVLAGVIAAVFTDWGTTLATALNAIDLDGP